MSRRSARAESRLAQRLAALLEQSAGIATPEHQLPVLLEKARRLVAEGGSLEALLARAAADEVERQRFVEAMCTHETRFFRHPEHFELLARSWVPERLACRSERRVRAWSVACSTGEEPYSLAMFLLDAFAGTGFDVEVLGSDVSQRVLEQARSATWPLARAGEISPERLAKYMLRGQDQQAGLMRARPELRAVVRLQQQNLTHRPYALAEDFDLVFLRNVLIYFSAETRAAVVQSVISLMRPGAWLVTGPSEGVSWLEDRRLRTVAPHIFVYGR